MEERWPRARASSASSGIATPCTCRASKSPLSAPTLARPPMRWVRMNARRKFQVSRSKKRSHLIRLKQLHGFPVASATEGIHNAPSHRLGQSRQRQIAFSRLLQKSLHIGVGDGVQDAGLELSGADEAGRQEGRAILVSRRRRGSRGQRRRLLCG